METQTDAFEERPQTPDFVPKKTGVDASTQIEVSDKLFDFEAEVQPMLAVLVGKVRVPRTRPFTFVHHVSPVLDIVPTIHDYKKTVSSLHMAGD